MRIVIIRHGISEFNIREKGDNPYFCGAYNTPLAEEGKQMASLLQENEYIKSIETIYSSDLDRAFETAKLAKPNGKIIKDKRLRERSLGVFENNPEKIIRKKYPEYFPGGKAIFRQDYVQKAPEGENYTDVCKRAEEFLNTLELSSNQTVGIFSHCHFIRCLLYTLANISRDDVFKLRIRNCDPIVLEGNKIGEFKIISHNIEDLFNDKKAIKI